MILIEYTDEQIEAIMAYYTREREVSMWGETYKIKPVLISEVQGDGMQVVFCTPIDTRPNYYVLRIDSSIDVDNDDDVYFEGEEFDLVETLLSMIEDEFGNIEDFNQVEIGDENFYQLDPNDELRTYEDVGFPVLHWSGGSWGEMCDVSFLFWPKEVHTEIQ